MKVSPARSRYFHTYMNFINEHGVEFVSAATVSIWLNRAGYGMIYRTRSDFAVAKGTAIWKVCRSRGMKRVEGEP